MWKSCWFRWLRLFHANCDDIYNTYKVMIFDNAQYFLLICNFIRTSTWVPVLNNIFIPICILCTQLWFMPTEYSCKWYLQNATYPWYISTSINHCCIGDITVYGIGAYCAILNGIYTPYIYWNPITPLRFVFVSFYPRPVLAFGYCRCQYLSVRVCVSIRSCPPITHHPFKLG